MTAARAKPKAPRRKKGAQPGNLNAIKHGLYASAMTPEELKLVENADVIFQTGLSNEIALLRIAIRRTAKLSITIKDWDNSRSVLATLASATSRLAGLIRTEKMLTGGEENTLATALSMALDQIAEELQIT